MKRSIGYLVCVLLLTGCTSVHKVNCQMTGNSNPYSQNVEIEYDDNNEVSTVSFVSILPALEVDETTFDVTKKSVEASYDKIEGASADIGYDEEKENVVVKVSYDLDAYDLEKDEGHILPPTAATQVSYDKDSYIEYLQQDEIFACAE